MNNFSLLRQICTTALIALAAVSLKVSAQSTNPARSLAELRYQLEQHLSAPRFSPALWGVKVVAQDTSTVLFEHHANRLMSPASNTKLYAGAVALDRLGADYRIETSLLAAAKPDRRGKLKGDLVIYGRGDPGWKLAAGRTNFWQVFDPFIAALTNAGVRRITGDLVADGTFLVGPPSGGSCTVDDLENSEGA